MDDTAVKSLEEIRAFLAGGGGVQFSGLRRADVYRWTEQTLVRHEYGRLGKADRGLVRRYVERMTGRSRAQITRLITSYLEHGQVKARVFRRRRFCSIYTRQDIELLAWVDRQHENLSGPATKRILEREYSEYGQSAYKRLSKISSAQIYRFRRSETYRKKNHTWQPTRPSPVKIGERRKPRPDGKPGYLRIDTVHQGDRDGQKGLYHINAVDEVTQWETVVAVPHISEMWLIPALGEMIEQFPFAIRGFHSDNGSEFVNYPVAEMLGKLFIEQTRSRAHRSGDNGLVESKNGAVVRKHMGFWHIESKHAGEVNEFHRVHLNPYLNFHRPSAVPTIVELPNGKRKTYYQEWKTPLEMFSGIAECEKYLRPGVTMAELEAKAMEQTDTEAARDMREAKQRLLRRVVEPAA